MAAVAVSIFLTVLIPLDSFLSNSHNYVAIPTPKINLLENPDPSDSRTNDTPV
jgi:hypothetical protein